MKSPKQLGMNSFPTVARSALAAAIEAAAAFLAVIMWVPVYFWLWARGGKL